LRSCRLTTTQLVEASGLKRTAVYAALAELVDAGKLSRDGKGTKGDPFSYSAVASSRPEPIPDGIGPDECIEADRDASTGEELSLFREARRIFADDLEASA
jgi:hypothetical protein